MNLDAQMMADASARKAKPDYHKHLQAREKLPIWERLGEILAALEHNQLVLVSGKPGSGKSTQLVQALMNRLVEKGEGSTFRAICAQRTELGTVAAARKVAQDLYEPCGGVDSPVGYQTSLNHQLPREKGSILYCTTEVLVQNLVSDPRLEEVSHLLLDEVHDRDMQMDFILAVLKPLLKSRGYGLKVILMSVYTNVDQIIKFFEDFEPFHLVISSKKLMVKTHYLEDILEEMKNFSIHTKNKKRQRDRTLQENELDLEYKRIMVIFKEKHGISYPQYVKEVMMNQKSEESPIELVMRLLKDICSAKERSGAILMFLPGSMEVIELRKKILADKTFRSKEYDIVEISSPPSDLHTLFDTPKPGHQKIILSTEVAETSISIDDVAHVIDCGRNRKEFYDPETNAVVVKYDWISHTNAEQRRARASRPGRSQVGNCYRLYSRARESTFADHPIPEIQRMRFDELILRIKFLAGYYWIPPTELAKAATFFQTLQEPPNDKSIQLNVELLANLGALDHAEHRTPLGFILAKLKMDPCTAKLVSLGNIFGCLEPLVNIAAVLWMRIRPFLVILGKNDVIHGRKKELNEGKRSDHLLFARVMKEFRAIMTNDEQGFPAAEDYCRLNFLDFSSMRSLMKAADQLCQELYYRKFVASPSLTDPKSNVNSGNEKLIRAVLCASLLHNIAHVHYDQEPVDGGAQQQPSIPSLTTSEGDEVLIHPGSVNFHSHELQSSWLCYGNRKKTSSIFLEECSEVSRSALLFSAGIGSEKLVLAEIGGLLRVTPRITLPVDEPTLTFLERRRTRFNLFLRERELHPSPFDWSRNTPHSRLLRQLIVFVNFDGQPLSSDSGSDSD